MKANFQRTEIFVDIAKKQCVVQDVKEDLANMLYQNGYGISTHALAFKIFNSDAETEYDEKECAIIRENVRRYCTPNVIDAVCLILDAHTES